MPRRNLIPIVLLAVLAVLTGFFAVVGATKAPTATTIQVQNAAEKTLGTPTGANSWVMELVLSVNVGAGTANGTTVRVIDYRAPDSMVIYNLSGSSLQRLGVLHQPAVSCVLSSYAAMLQGQASWQQKGGTFTRTESLADYSARVPQANGSNCEAVASTAQGQVHQTAVIRSGYVVKVQAVVVAPTHGTQSELLYFLKIGNVRVSTLK
jgi:hypothetical protein